MGVRIPPGHRWTSGSPESVVFRNLPPEILPRISHGKIHAKIGDNFL